MKKEIIEQTIWSVEFEEWQTRPFIVISWTVTLCDGDEENWSRSFELYHEHEADAFFLELQEKEFAYLSVNIKECLEANPNDRLEFGWLVQSYHWTLLPSEVRALAAQVVKINKQLIKARLGVLDAATYTIGDLLGGCL